MISLRASNLVDKPCCAEAGATLRVPSAIHLREISILQQLFASSVGALLTSLLVTPMDVVKIRLQSQVRPLTKGDCFLYSNGLMDHLCRVCETRVANGIKYGKGQACEWFNRPGHFTGTFDAVMKITRNEGFRSLWSGLSPTMLSAVPATVFYFTLYDNLHYAFREAAIGSRSQVFAPLVAGAFARAASVTVVSPLELVRTKMQSERLSYLELSSAISRTVNSEGYSALWRGWGATMLRDIPFSAVYWTTYESLKRQFLVVLNAERTNFTISFLCGTISGAFASILTLPFDVIKTHQQITLGENYRSTTVNGGAARCEKKKLNQRGVERGVFRIAEELVHTKGASALFTGLVPRVARVAPACAIMIGSYEHFKSFFEEQNDQ